MTNYKEYKNLSFHPSLFRSLLWFYVIVKPFTSKDVCSEHILTTAYAIPG